MELLLDLPGLTQSGFKEIDQYVLVSDARRGDHIVARSATRIVTDVAWHHGIFLSKNRVAHMHPSGNISIVNLKAFFAQVEGESPVYQTGVIEYGSADSDEIREWSAMLAEALAGNAAAHKLVYDALGANCERFATFCRTGRHDDIATYDVFVSRVLSKVPLILAASSPHPKSNWFGI